MDSVSSYIAKFERVLYEAKGQDWPDVNKISTFRNGLSSTIRNHLAQQLNLPHKYPDFIRVIQQLAAHSHVPTTGNPSGNGSNSHGDPMDTSLGAIISVIDPVNTADAAKSSPSPPPRRARSISPSRREQYWLEGRCVRCGSHNHWVSECSLSSYTSGRGKVIDTPEEDFSDGGSSVSSYNSRDQRTIARLDWKRRVGA